MTKTQTKDTSAKVLQGPAFQLDVKALDSTDQPGTFEGYGSVFGNKDRDGDIVSKGSFTASLKERMPAFLWQHNPTVPLGVFDEVREDAKGLYVKGRFLLEGKGKEAYDLMKMGALNSFSIGYITRKSSQDRATGTRTITKADLWEISLVTFPSNELAQVTGIKSSDKITTIRDLEAALRDEGYSRSEAKAVASRFVEAKTEDGLRDACQKVADITAQVKRNIEILK